MELKNKYFYWTALAVVIIIGVIAITGIGNPVTGHALFNFDRLGGSSANVNVQTGVSDADVNLDGPGGVANDYCDKAEYICNYKCIVPLSAGGSTILDLVLCKNDYGGTCPPKEEACKMAGDDSTPFGDAYNAGTDAGGLGGDDVNAPDDVDDVGTVATSSDYPKGYYVLDPNDPYGVGIYCTQYDATTCYCENSEDPVPCPGGAAYNAGTGSGELGGNDVNAPDDVEPEDIDDTQIDACYCPYGYGYYWAGSRCPGGDIANCNNSVGGGEVYNANTDFQEEPKSGFFSRLFKSDKPESTSGSGSIFDVSTESGEKTNWFKSLFG